MLIELLGTSFSEIWIKNKSFIQQNTFENVVYKMVTSMCLCKHHKHETGDFNISTPSGAYMCQWTGSVLPRVRVWHLFGTKPLPGQTGEIQIKITKHLINENAFGNVIWEMAAILSRWRWVNTCGARHVCIYMGLYLPSYLQMFCHDSAANH